MSESTTQRNKAFVLEGFETLFNKKDFVAAEKFWSSNYIQHSAHIPVVTENSVRAKNAEVPIIREILVLPR